MQGLVAKNINQYAKRVLLCTTGMSPQVVTETLYALAVAATEAERFIPTEIHLITTAEGAERARLSLITGEQGKFYQLCRLYQLPAITFTPEHIHVVTGEDGMPMADIRTPKDNQRMADFITSKVQFFCNQPDCALHVSIAGGRKTMGYYLGYALSLFGRDQDRLSHVLVSEHFESQPGFFFPTPDDKLITTYDNRYLNARDACVMLADIPFVRLRHELPQNALVHHMGFTEVVERFQEASLPPHLKIDFAAKEIRVGRRVLELPPRDWIMFAWFARRAAALRDGVTIPCEGEYNREYAAEYLQEQHRLLGEFGTGGSERTEVALERGMDKSFFESRKSYLNRQLRQQLGQKLATHYEIKPSGPRGYSRFAIQLSPEQIEIIE